MSSWGLWVRRVGDSAGGEGGSFQSAFFGGGVGWEVFFFFFPGVYSAVVHQAVYSQLLSIYQTMPLHLLRLTAVLPMVPGSIRKHSGLRNSEER